MVAKFIEIPAEVLLQEFDAEEKAEQRKLDRRPRQSVSNSAAAFNALLEVGGVKPDAHRPLHILLDKSRGYAPDERLAFSEKDAGRLIPGKEGAADSSLRRRWTRAWDEILEPEMKRTGKRFAGERQKGAIILATRQRDEKKICPSYRSEIAQAVVDVERRARQLKGKRSDKFKRAALEVWQALPDYVATEETDTIGAERGEHGQDRKSGKRSRAMQRLTDALHTLIAENKEAGDGALLALAGSIADKLVDDFAEALDVEKDNVRALFVEAFKGTTDGENPAAETGEFVHTIKNEKCKNTEQNDVSQGFTVDRAVNVEGVAIDTSCVACGEEISPARLSFDTELCDQCGPPRDKRRPPPLHLVKETPESPPKESQDRIIYAEDYTV